MNRRMKMVKKGVAILGIVLFFIFGYFYGTYDRGPEVLLEKEPALHQIRCGDLYYFIPLPEINGSLEEQKSVYELFAEGYCRHLENEY